MLKTVGGGLLFFVSTAIGFKMSHSLKKRAELLGELIHSLERVKSNIEFARFDLKSIFRRLNNPFFTECSERMEKEGLRQAWESGCGSLGEAYHLTDEDIKIIKRLGESLGKSDTGGQIKCINITICDLREQWETSKDEYMRLAKVYRGCGFLFGVFILIILL